MRQRTNRRGFLKSAAATAATAWILGDSRSASTYQANEKLNIAAIGVGGRGAQPHRHARRHAQGQAAP